ncbi:MAG: energy transducer TonB [Paracoccaceae bacterium]
MYRPQTRPADRAATIAAVVAIHAALGFALLHLSGTVDLLPRQPNLEVFDITPPVPPPPPPVIEQPKPKPKDKEGAASAANIKSKATPVVAPKPRVVIPTPPKIVVTPTPGTGSQSTQGAAPVAGPGTGAGGSGTGTGSGGSGTGTGGGGSGTGTGPRLASRSLTERDYPSSLTRTWPRGAPVFVKFHVQLDGRATGCEVTRGSGNPVVDQVTCSLVENRLRFRPAVDGQGRPYVAWFGYVQRPLNF